MISSTWTFAFGICLLHSISANNGKTNDPDKFQEEASQIYSTIFHKYNEKVRPPDNYPQPVLVKINATLHHIRDLDIYKQEMESLLDLKIMWRDKRLAWYPYQVSQISADVDTIWSPNVAYKNGAVPPKAMYVPKVQIKHDGEITWTRRESITTVCHTQPGSVNQTCEISLGFVSPGNAEAFDNDTVFDLDPTFDNHIWDVIGADLDISQVEINLAITLTSRTGNENGVIDPQNCSHSLSYTTSRSSVVGVLNSLLCILVIIAILKSEKL